MTAPRQKAKTKPGNATAEASFWTMADSRFKSIVTLLIAGTAFLGTVTAALRVGASAQAAVSSREARAFIIKAVAKGNAGTQRYTLERNMLAEFQALVMEGSVDLRLAQEAVSKAEAVGYLQDAARLNQLRESLRVFSSLLSPPYYDEKSGGVDVLRFGADYMVTPPVRWTEMQRVKGDEADAWENKGGRYIVLITILAVSLFLFGLSLTLGQRLKFLFVALGVLIAAAAAGGVAATVMARVPKTSDEAIKSYVEGAGKLYYASMLALAGGDTPRAEAEVVRRADMAIGSFGEAVAFQHDYAAARQALGETHLLVAQTLLFSRGDGADPEQAGAELTLALDSLSWVVKRGRADRRLWASLSWAEFLAGNYDRSIAAAERALDLSPDLKLSGGLSVALSLLAGGKPEAAMARLEEALKWAETHPLASDVFAFRGMIQSVDRLMDVRPFDGLNAFGKRLKEAFVSMAYRKTCEVKPTPATISPLRFALPVLDDQGRVAARNPMEIFPVGTGRVDILFEYAKLARGCQVVQKVIWQGREATWLTRVYDWTGGASGRAAWVVREPVPGTMAGLNPGRYTVELYVDGNLLQAGAFEIASPVPTPVQ
jgi:tetratricopeptide (TPR) repeat protein